MYKYINNEMIARENSDGSTTGFSAVNAVIYNQFLIDCNDNGLSLDSEGKPVPDEIYLLSIPGENAEQLASRSKMEGILFEGVLCSANSNDMYGLSAIKPWIESGQSTNFKFSNGNSLLVTPANVAALEAVWTPFRASFFV